MQHSITDPNHICIILNNIIRLRNAKGIISKIMAYEIGMSPSEYSKLEGGKKHNWEKWLDKIAEVLGVDKYILMMTESEKPSKIKSHYDSNAIEKQNEDSVLLIKTLNDSVERLTAEVEYWKSKYYREKERLIKAENEIEKISKISDVKNGKLSSNMPVSLAIVGGGIMIN